MPETESEGEEVGKVKIVRRTPRFWQDPSDTAVTQRSSERKAALAVKTQLVDPFAYEETEEDSETESPVVKRTHRK